MLLTLDIGNTNVTIGVFDGERLKARGRFSTDVTRQPDEYGLLLDHLLTHRGVSTGQIDAVSMCSVVPPLTSTFVELCETYYRTAPLVVGAGTKTGIKVLYDQPRDVGADRIADAVAAMKLYGGPAIVVDIGTATVFNAITRDGEYLGGAIAPGLNMAAEALFFRTAMLRRVDLTTPPSAIGRNTVHAMQSGIVLGYAELVKGMVARFQAELGGGATVIATGGLARVLFKETGVFHHLNPDLTLIGLRLIYEMNVK